MREALYPIKADSHVSTELSQFAEDSMEHWPCVSFSLIKNIVNLI
jgi:hypothetical protein